MKGINLPLILVLAFEVNVIPYKVITLSTISMFLIPVGFVSNPCDPWDKLRYKLTCCHFATSDSWYLYI